jgi:hypothetical protein
MRSVSAAEPLTLKLPAARFELLIALVTTPNPRNRRGFQSRFAHWLGAIDEQERTIRLSGRDVLWIRKLIIDRRVGTFQERAAGVFAGTHAHFANLPIKPWRNFALNMPIQGGCAEAMMLALARIDKALRPYPARLVLSIHDELLFECDDDPAVVAAVGDIVVREMTAAFLMVFPDAPTLNLVEPTVGPNWGEQTKVAEWLAERSGLGGLAASNK